MSKLIAAILAVTLTPLAAWGETPKDSWENLKQLKAGHKIKVVDMDLKAWDGKLVSVSDDAITIREKQKQQEITVERTKVLRVRDLQRSRRGRNAALGFLVGAIVPMTRDTGDLTKSFVVGVLGGAGAAVGALIPGHPTIYRSKAGPQKTLLDSSERGSRQ